MNRGSVVLFVLGMIWLAGAHPLASQNPNPIQVKPAGVVAQPSDPPPLMEIWITQACRLCESLRKRRAHYVSRERLVPDSKSYYSGLASPEAETDEN